jgi:hypothetical protein
MPHDFQANIVPPRREVKITGELAAGDFRRPW